MKFLVVNAFTLNMLNRQAYKVDLVPISVEGVRNIVKRNGVTSAIGHVGTASLVANMIGLPEKAQEWDAIAATRPTVNLGDFEDTSLIVAQYRGPRLPEGATELPENAEIEFWQVYKI